MSELQLERVQQAHHQRFLGLQVTTSDLVGNTWDKYANLDDVAAAEFSAAAGLLVDTAKLQTATIAVGYMKANDRLGGFDDPGLIPTMPEIRNGIPTVDVYHRSIVTARTAISKGQDYADAMAAGRSRAVATARTDVLLANKTTIAAGGQARPWIVGYRRVLTGQSCAFCALVSTQRYHSADLLPIHPSCDCDVAEIFGTADPGQVINRALLKDIKETGSFDGPYIVDEHGAIRAKQIEYVKDADGKQLYTPNGNPVRRAVAGDKVKADVVEHPELGPVVGPARAPTATAPTPPAPPEVTAPRRSKATVQDPDVLAEAGRLNVSADRVVALREEKAQRRFLEDHARREAAKNLTAADPEVRRIAEKYGVHPDEVLTARARVADVRAIAREEAARTQLEAITELDRLDAVKLKPPPLKTAKTGTGRAARGGEYDFLEQVSDREKGRISRQWYGGTLGPDQIAANMSNALGRDLSTDEAMDLWLDLNRRSEAAGALRRGKLPSLDAYSGHVDVADLIPRLSDEGYDVARVFGEDLDAAGHIASVDANLVRDDALNYLGDAANATHGPAPYRMTFDSWEGEVRDLEYRAANGGLDAAGAARYAELVPPYLDDAGLSFEELHARIISTARKAGEDASGRFQLAASKFAPGPGQSSLFDVVAEAPATTARPVVEAVRPPAGYNDVRNGLQFEDKAARAKFGPTTDRLAELHGAPRDTLGPVRVVNGGKTTTKGGHFAPSGEQPNRPAWRKSKTIEENRDAARAWRADNSWRHPEIKVNNRGTGDELLCYLHEYGHRLDFLNVGRGSWTSNDMTDPLVAAFRKAATDTDAYTNAYKNFRGHTAYVNYYRSNEEVWARAYSQWAANALGGPELESLNAMRAADAAFQWTDEEFATLAPHVEAILRSAGLIA